MCGIGVPMALGHRRLLGVRGVIAARKSFGDEHRYLQTRLHHTVTGAASWRTPHVRVAPPPAVPDGAHVTPKPTARSPTDPPSNQLAPVSRPTCSGVLCCAFRVSGVAAVCGHTRICITHFTPQTTHPISATTSSSSCRTSLFPCIAATCSGLQLGCEVCVRG